MNKITKKIISAVATVTMLSSLMVLPQTAQAAGNMPDYYDPAYRWNHTSSRASELDTNAIIFEGPGKCNSRACKDSNDGQPKDTMFTSFRVPEYTKGGKSNADYGMT